MKTLSWRDIVTTVLAAAGGTVLYARLHDFSWTLVNSWRGTVLTLGVIGVLMPIAGGYDMSNMRSMLNRLQMMLGGLAAVLVVLGLIFSSKFLGVSVAIVLGVEFLISIARNARRSYIYSNRYISHHPSPAH